MTEQELANLEKGRLPKTYVDPAGRVCTVCGEYKLWKNYTLLSKQSRRQGKNPFRSACDVCRRDEMRQKRGHSPKPYGTKTNGYRVVHINGKQVMMHRLIMEIMLARPLEDWENVHHKNGNRADNHYDNLELWCRPQPTGCRVEDLVDWVIQNYSGVIDQRLQPNGRS